MASKHTEKSKLSFLLIYNEESKEDLEARMLKEAK